MKCKSCPHDLGYRAGMHWPPYEEKCGMGKRAAIDNKGELYNRKCKEEKMPDPNREFAKLCGIQRHELTFQPSISFECCATCSCGQSFRWLPFAHEHERTANPNFKSDPRLVLREAMKWEDWPKFAESLRQHADKIGIGSMAYMVELMTDQTGLLVKAAIEWKRRKGL
jgi:hypothetical protein